VWPKWVLQGLKTGTAKNCAEELAKSPWWFLLGTRPSYRINKFRSSIGLPETKLLACVTANCCVVVSGVKRWFKPDQSFCLWRYGWNDLFFCRNSKYYKRSCYLMAQ